MPDTYWSYSIEDQTARVCFMDDVHTSVIQHIFSSGSTQAAHGKYTADGHSVVLDGENWSKSIKLVRTFSHLKNSSTNKNMTPLYQKSHKSLAGSVWATLVNGNLYVVLFDGNGKCTEAAFNNVTHKEGLPIGWSWNRKDYSLNGSSVDVGDQKARLFEDFMVIDTLAVLRSCKAVEDNASSLTGTFWPTTATNTYPGVIVFTGASTFTRILANSSLVYQTNEGTYTFDGTTFEFDLGDKKETCPLNGDRFTFLGKEYRRNTTPESLP